MSNGTNWKPIIISCSALAFIGVCTVCGVGGLLYNRVTKNPETHPGFGSVKAVASKDGWTTFALKDCDLTIDLKASPQPSPQNFSMFNRVRIASYSRYLSRGTFAVIILDETLRSGRDPVDPVVRSLERSISRDPLVSGFSADQSILNFPGVPSGTLLSTTYTYKGLPKFANFAIFSSGKRLLIVRGTFTGHPKDDHATWDHLLHSIHWTPTAIGSAIPE